ncbi:MAG: hypothetical protein KIS81_08645 [Maricaulaceae bacterium]|nr:hypothetical protein [Maricaulaceae bacterium]
MTAAAIDFAPLVPWPWLIGLVALALGAAALAGVMRLNGWPWRAGAALVLAAALANPSLVREERDPLPDIAVLVTDASASMDVGGRRQAAEAVRDAARAAAEADPLLELVEAEIGDSPDGTRMYEALTAALSGVPRDRLAGVIVAGDGQFHDLPRDPAALRLPAPLHHAATGDPAARDRRLVIVEAARYALVGQPAAFTVRVEDDAVSGTAMVTFRVDGGPPQPARVRIGEDTRVEARIDRRGANVIEIEVEEGPEELSLVNNRAAVSVTGVRDRLRVLLVTGEPHNGARMWRDLLKSDPSVDLVHFTILRPPEKQDGVPIDELALIAFPTRELFAERLNEFDLVIFDRYRRRGIMPMLYFDYIARYVEDGGALLLTSGPPFAGPTSLYRTPLAAVIPARPSGAVIEGGFRPRPTAAGRRHPVTAGLAPESGEPQWGRWFRRIDAAPVGGAALLEAEDGGPLLVLARSGEGRAAMVLSDQTWLWARGFEGGGPYAEMFRRVAHWLMGEPDLDEERLTATAHDGRLGAERTTLSESAPPLEIEWPSGRRETVDMIPAGAPGRFAAAATYGDGETGLARLRSGDLTTVAALGPLNPREFADLRVDTDSLRPFAAHTGGGVFLAGDGDSAAAPAIRRTRPGASQAGRGWLGLQRNERYVVRAASQAPLLPALAVLLLTLGLMGYAWRREGR